MLNTNLTSSQDYSKPQLDEVVHKLDTIEQIPIINIDSVDFKKHYDLTLNLYYAGESELALNHSETILEKAFGRFFYWEQRYTILLANIHSNRGNYDSSTELYNRLIPKQEELKLYTDLTLVYGNMSSDFYGMKDYTNSKKYALETIKTAKKQKDTTHGLATALIILGHIQSLYGNDKKATDYYTRSYQIDSTRRDSLGMSIALTNIGLIYIEQEKYDDGIPYLIKAFEIDSLSRNVNVAISTQIQIANAYYWKGDLIKAYKYAKSAEQKAKETKISIYDNNILKTFVNIGIEKNDNELAYRYFDKYAAFKDSLLTTRVQENLAKARLQFERTHEQRESAINLEKAEIELKNKNNLLLLSSGILLLFVVLLTVIYKKRNSTIRLKNQLEIKADALTNTNKELEAAAEMNKNLTNIIIHDLKSPWNSVEGILDLMRHEATDKPKFIELIEILNNVTGNAQEIIHGMMAIAKIEDGANEKALEPLQLAPVITRMMKAHELPAKRKDQEIIHVIKHDVKVLAVESYLVSILSNLFTNAIKFSGPKAVCRVILEKDQNNAIITVSDQGPGFDKNDKKKLYSKFGKLNARPTKNESSTGLGLYTVKLLVEKMHGSIELTETSSEGSTFTITLPEYS